MCFIFVSYFMKRLFQHICAVSLFYTTDFVLLPYCVWDFPDLKSYCSTYRIVLSHIFVIIILVFNKFVLWLLLWFFIFPFLKNITLIALLHSSNIQSFTVFFTGIYWCTKELSLYFYLFLWVRSINVAYK